MAKIKLDLSSIRSAFEDFLDSLFGEKIMVFEPGQEMKEFTPEEYEEYKKKRDAGQDAEKEPLPSPTPEDQPKVRLASEVKDQEEGGGGEGEDPLSGFKTTKVPEDFKEAILKASEKHDIDPNLLAAGLFQESSFRPNVINQGETAEGKPFRARGAAQIVDIYHPDISDEEAFNPEVAAEFYANYLDENREKFGGDLSRALASYFVGPGGASVEGPEPFGGGPQGQTYINNVARNLTYDLIKDLGLKVSPSLLEEYGL